MTTETNLFEIIHLRTRSFETTTFETTTFETTFILDLFIWDHVLLRHSFETTFTWDFFIWDHVPSRPHSFDTIFIWDNIHLRSHSFYATTFHFFAGDLEFCKVTLHLKFCKVTPFRVQGDSRWVVNALHFKTPQRPENSSYVWLRRERCTSGSHFVTPSQRIVFYFPARFLYRSAAVISVFNWEMKDEKRKNVFLHWSKEPQEKTNLT